VLLLLIQIICSSLIAVGLFFLLIDLRTKFDKSFRYFGIALLLLCAMTGIDLWIIPRLQAPAELLYWNRIMYTVGCVFSLFYFWYMAELTRTVKVNYIRVLGALAFALCAGFQTDGMLTMRGGQLTPGPLYYALFMPYMTFCLFSANLIILRKLARAPAGEKRILCFHLAGFLLLFTCGVLDLTFSLFLHYPMRISFNTFGATSFGIMASLIFTERFLQLLKERDATFAKLESAYRDLEQVNALKQLGESTAIINHEIKNYMFMISGNAQLLSEVEHLSQKGSEIVKNIVTSVERLTGFSDDILKLSRTQIVKERTPVNLAELIKGVVEKHYPGRAERFTLIGCEKDHFLHGDWGKLEQVFVNIFNNSFEAGAGRPVDIRVRMAGERGFLLVSVEDNGAGCDEAQLAGLFQAFYTTKKASGGTGLGMSISRTIVESHGGRISAYSKNLARKGDHGLKLILTFPVFAQNMSEDSQRKHPIVLIKDSMDNLADVIRVFQNVKVNPYVIQGIEELNEEDFPPDSMTVLVNARTMAANFTRLAGYPWLCMVSHHERNLYILDHGRGNRPEAFSEEYVVNRFLRRNPLRRRMREREAQPAAHHVSPA
jgi:signal transduction histidine kinase